MNQQRTGIKAAELVPIADRLRYMQGFRVGAIALTALVAAALDHGLLASVAVLVAATAGYGLIAVAAQVGAQRLRGHGTALFGAMLIVDGLYLAFASWATGGAGSPVRYVIVLHLIAVALLASYRTGLKLALWHSLLLIVVFYAERAGILANAPAAGIGIGTPFQRLIEFSVVFWLVAIATASLAAVNERELRRRRYDLEALAAMATQLESVSEPSEVGEALVDAVVDSFDFARAVLIASRAAERPRAIAARGTAAAASRDGDIGSGSVLAAAMSSRRTYLVTHLEPAADPWLDSLLPDAQRLVVVPLSAEGHPIGALVAEHGRRVGPRIERRIVAMVERFASHAALGLCNAWLLEQVRRMATRDGLTGLTNRSSFDETLATEIARGARRGDDVSLLMLDIDHFKRLNDLRGHRAGDEVLRRVAAELELTCREIDVVARYGGEEFAVVLPATAEAEAGLVAERLRVAVGNALADSGITISIGSATFPVDGVSPEELIQAADEALYESKRNGRNRVTAAHREPVVLPAEPDR